MKKQPDEGEHPMPTPVVAEDSSSSSSSSSTLVELTCPKCQLSFSNKKSLYVHTEKFCDRMKEIIAKTAIPVEGVQANTPSSYMTFEEVKHYLTTAKADEDKRAAGQLSLETLRQNIQNNEMEMNALRIHLHKKRAEEKADELRQLKARQQEARAKKLKDHEELEALMQAEVKEKEKEIKAGMEREKIARELRKVEESKLGDLQKEKAQKLAMLEQEKQLLKQKEQEMLEQIKTIEGKILKRDTELQEQAALLKKKEEDSAHQGSGTGKEQFRQRYAEMATQYGTRVARMEQEKAQLLVDQDKTRADLQSCVEKSAKQSKKEGERLDDPDALTSMVEQLSSEKGLEEQECRLRNLQAQLQEAGHNELEKLAGTETEPHKETSARLRDKEMAVLSSASPTRLPLARDAEQMLEQWLKSETQSSTSTAFGSLMGGMMMMTEPKQRPSPKRSVGKGTSQKRRMSSPRININTVSEPEVSSSNGQWSKVHEREGGLAPVTNATSRKSIERRQSVEEDNESIRSHLPSAIKQEPQSPSLRVSITKAADPTPGSMDKEMNASSANYKKDNPVNQQQQQQQQPIQTQTFGPHVQNVNSYRKELETLRRRYMESGGNNAAIFRWIQQMEMDLEARERQATGPAAGSDWSNPSSSLAAASLVPPSSTFSGGTRTQPYFDPYSSTPMQTYLCGEANAFGLPPHMAGHSPYQQQQQQYLVQAYQQLASLEAENVRLEEEMDRLDANAGLASHNLPSTGTSYRSQSPFGGNTSLTPADASLRHKGQVGVADDLLKTLSALPPGHKLHKLWESHVEELTSMQLEVEKMQKLSQLENLKQRLIRSREAQLKEQQHQERISEQKRLAQVLKLQRTIGGPIDALSKLPEATEENAGYESTAGITVYLDFVIGIVERLTTGLDVKKARVIYGLYEGLRPYGVPKPGVWVDCKRFEAEANGKYPMSCHFDLRFQLPNIVSSSTLSLIIEVHLGDESVTDAKQSKFQGGGWAYIPLFYAGGTQLNRGFHKLSLYAGSFSPNAFDTAQKVDGGAPMTQQFAKKLQRNGAKLHLRVMYGDDDAGDFRIEHPDLQVDAYLTPRPRTPKVREGSTVRSQSDSKGDPPPYAKDALRRPSTKAASLATPAAGHGVSSIPQAQPPASIPSAPVSAANSGRDPSVDTQAAPVQKPMAAETQQLPDVSSQEVADGKRPSIQMTNGLQAQDRRESDANVDRRPSLNAPGSARRPSLTRRASLRRSGSSLGSNDQDPSSETQRHPLLKRDSVFLNGPNLLGQGDNQENNDDEEEMEPLPLEDNKSPLIENVIPGGSKKIRRTRFRKGDGFNIYIDGARGLPDNVSISKITLRVLTAQNRQVGVETTALSSVEGYRASPEYKLCAEFANEDNLDPTATLLLRMDTVDRWSKKICCVGYAVLNIFVAMEDVCKQPTTSDNRDFQLNLGAFQIPLHQGPPNMKVAFTTSSLLQIKRVPSATVLVRITGLEEKGKTIPSYGQGLYDSSRCLPTEFERLIYERRLLKQSGHSQLLRAAVVETFLSDGPSPDASAEAINSWMSSKLSTKPTDLLDLNCLLRYQPDLGFRVTVDMLYNMPSPGLFQTPKLYKMIYLLSPPALYYNDPPLTEDAHITKEYDLESNVLAPSFQDSTHVFRDVQPDPSMVVLVEVRGIKQEKGQVVVEPAWEGYWTALPVFSDRGYVNNGDFQVPLFKGSIPPFVLGASDVYKCIYEEVKKSASKPKGAVKTIEISDGSSLSLRLADVLINDFTEPLPHTQVKNPMGRKNVSYLEATCDAANINHFVFDAREPATDKTIAKLIPKKKDEQEFLREVNIRLTEETNICHYKFGKNE